MNEEDEEQLIDITKKLNRLCTNILIVRYSKHPSSFNLNQFKRSCAKQLYDLLNTNVIQQHMLNDYTFPRTSDLINPNANFTLDFLYQKASDFDPIFMNITVDLPKFDKSYIRLYEDLKNCCGKLRGAMPLMHDIKYDKLSYKRMTYQFYTSLEKILISPISQKLMKHPKDPLCLPIFFKLPFMIRLGNTSDRINFKFTFSQVNDIRKYYLHNLTEYIKTSLLSVLCGTLGADLQSLVHFAKKTRNQLNDELSASNSASTVKDVEHEQRDYVGYLVRKVQYLFGDYQDYHFLFIFKLLPDLSSMLNKPYNHNSLTSLIRVLNIYINSCDDIKYCSLHHTNTVKKTHMNHSQLNNSSSSDAKSLKLSKELVNVIKKQNKLAHKKYKILKKLNELNFKGDN